MKIKLKCFVITLALFISIKAASQTSNCSICGNWKTFKKTNLTGSDGSDVTFSGKPFSTNMELLIDKKTIRITRKPSSYEFAYSIKDSVLNYYNNKSFIIHSLKKDTLILKEYNNLGGFIYYMKKHK